MVKTNAVLGSHAWLLLSLIFFFYTSYIQTKIEEMDHLNISFQEMEQEISSLSMKTQATYRPPRGWTGKKNPSTSFVLKPSTERQGNPWSLNLNSLSRSMTSMTMNQFLPRRFTRRLCQKCPMLVSETWFQTQTDSSSHIPQGKIPKSQFHGAGRI